MRANGWKGVAVGVMVAVAIGMAGCVSNPFHERNMSKGDNRYTDLLLEHNALLVDKNQNAATEKRRIEVMEAMREQNPHSDLTVSNIAEANMMQGNWNKAAYWYEKLLALLDKEGVVKCGKGKTRTAIKAAGSFWKSGEVDKAIAFAERANKLAKEIGDDQPDCSAKENKHTHDDTWVRTEAAKLLDRLNSTVLKPLEIEVKKSGPANKKYVNSIGMEFIYIPPGSFMMGSPENEKGRKEVESPQHQVTLTKGYWLQTTEVTQEQYQQVMATTPSKFKGRTNPVEMVSWNDAQEFISKLNEKEKTTVYRLPSEAEWEYAARAGTTTTWFFGNDEAKLAQYAWYEKNANEKTQTVATRHPNQWGLYDMSGNVWEWVEDCHHYSYQGAPSDGSAWTSGECEYRVLRGGSWFNIPQYARAANRGGSDPADRGSFVGFRLARTLP